MTEERTQEVTAPPEEQAERQPPDRVRPRRNSARAEERGEGTSASPGPVTTRSMRARLARVATRNQPGNPELDPLFRAVRTNHPKADLGLLERAYNTAAEMHGTQMRKSGDPYITHPLAVTTILADIGMTEATLVAALLHDTVEDTRYTLEQVRADFGDEVAQLVEAVCRVLDGVVQQRGRERRGRHAELGEDRRHGERVRDVGVTALAHLPFVRVLGDGIRPLDDREVGLRVVLADRRHERLQDGVAGRPGRPETRETGAHPRRGGQLVADVLAHEESLGGPSVVRR